MLIGFTLRRVSKGNIVDMAVGVVIGGAFGKIVTSLVTDIISPVISLLTGQVMLKDLKYVIREEVLDEAGQVLVPESAFTYGNFIQTIIDFLIIALSVFIVLRIIMKTQDKIKNLSKKKAEEVPAAPTTKICPFCKSEIAIDATRCAHCTSELKD